MRIYLDNCCFNRPFDNQSQLRIRLETEAKTRIQEYILTNAIELIWSYMLEHENDINPFKERRKSIEKWRQLAKIDIEENNAIIQNANEFINIGLRSKDAIHIACAIYSHCDFFLTTDDKILSKSHLVKEITISDPIEFIKEFEK